MVIKITSEKIDGNCYIISEGDRAVIIDPADGEKVIRELEERNLSPDFVILTHEHFDHIGGLEEVREKYSVPVIACKICSENICTVKGNLSNISGILEFFKTGIIPEETMDPFVCNEADITFDKEYDFSWKNHKFALKRLPGHSPGSTLITFDDRAVFTGDYLIKDKEVITRLKGGSGDDYENITRPVLEGIPVGTHIYPGHDDDYIKEG